MVVRNSESSSNDTETIWRDREVTARTVAEFVHEVSQLLPRSQAAQASHWWFRGQSNQDWDLEPSFLRITGKLGLNIQEAIELEQAAQTEFRSKAHLYLDSHLLDKVKTHACWWAVMQHHAAPTRLLDWSTSPYVAAYFAAQQDGSGNDGAVWCFCSGRLATTFSETYKGEVPDFTKTEGEDPCVEKFFRELQRPDAVRAVAPITFPFISSERIATQQGRFTMCLRIHQKHNCIADQVGQDQVKRIIVPHDKKPEFLAQLRSMNITASALFPGIDGLGRSVAELAALGAKASYCV